MTKIEICTVIETLMKLIESGLLDQEAQGMAGKQLEKYINLL